MDQPYEVIAGKKVFKDPVEFIGRQTAHVADAKADYIATDLDAAAEVATAVNATNTILNAILAVLEGLGFSKSA